MWTRAQTLLIYGETGTYKTTQVGEVAAWVYKKTGKITRLVNADGGGTDAIQPLIEAGIIDEFQISSSSTPWGTLRKLSKGYWKSKQTLAMTTDWDKVGAYAVESLTSISLLAMRHTVEKKYRFSEDVVGGFTEDQEFFGAPSRSHYNAVQNLIYGLLAWFPSLPIQMVVFTALEGKGEDDRTRRVILGPAAIGKAATANIGPQVGDLFHFSRVRVGTSKDPATGREKPDSKVMAFFTPHPDPETGQMWPAKVRVAAESVESLYKAYPGGYVPLEISSSSVVTLLDMRDSLQAKALEEVKKWKH
jgi:hypothetical protein